MRTDGKLEPEYISKKLAQESWDNDNLKEWSKGTVFVVDDSILNAKSESLFREKDRQGQAFYKGNDQQ